MHVAPLVLTALLALASPASPTQAEPPAERAWTFLIYAACDNDAEEDGNFFAFLDGVRGALSDEAGVEVVLLIDRSNRYSTNARTLGEDFADTRLYRVRSRDCERLAGGEMFPEITLQSSYEADSADPQNVRKFIAFGKARFPARRYALMLYGHADGRAMCPDEQSGREMGFSDLVRAGTEREAVDLMALELCNMAGVEIAYEWRPGNGGFSTRTLVAIPNAGPPLDWARVFARLRARAENGNATGRSVDPSELSAKDFGSLIVEEGGAGRREAREEREAVGCFDLDQAQAVKRAVDALAVELWSSGAKEVLEELRGPGPDGFTLNYSRDRLDRTPFVDLHDLCRRASACERLDAKVRAASEAVCKAVDAFVVASWGGSELPRFEAGASGVFITFPDGDAETRGLSGGPQRVWARCRWYSPLPVPGVGSRLAWCKDGAQPGNGKVENWFELLDGWFDDTREGPEGVNGYAF